MISLNFIVPRKLNTPSLIITFLTFCVFSITSFSQTLINTQQFVSSTGWLAVSNASATSWNMLYNQGSPNACGGDANHARIAADASNDDFVISQSFTLTANYSYSITLSHKNTQTFDIYAGTAQTVAAMTGGTNMLSTTANPGSCTTVSTSSSFVPTVTGTYYFGFRVRGNSGAANLDFIRFYETAPATITWDGSSSTAWATAANWDLNRVPNSTDNIIVPASLINYPLTVPSGAYNSLSLTNGGSSFTTTINATSFSSNLTIVSSSTGNTVTIASALSVGGNISIGTSGNAFNFNCNAAVTGLGTLGLGNASTAITSSFAAPISVTGAFTMGSNTSSSTMISYAGSSTTAISASNSGTFVFYGAFIYSASSGDQIVMKSQYNGAVSATNGGNRFMEGNLDLNSSLTLTGGNWFCGASETLTLGSGNSSDANQKDELSPYQGSNKSARWQMFIKPSEMASMGTDILTSLSLFVTTKRSTSPYQAFTIKLGHTSSTKFVNSAPSFFLNDATTTVFNSQSISTAAGWNTHIFNTPFIWDGVSSILVDISYFNTSPNTTPGGIDAISVTTGVFGDDALIRAEGSASQVAQTDGVNSDDRPYTKFNTGDGPFNINITNDWLNTGTEFYHLSNTVTFDGTTNQNVTTRGENYYNYTVNNTTTTTALTLLDDCNIEGTGTLTDGVVTTGSFKLIALSSVASKFTGYSNASYVKGNLRRYIGTNASTYGFPLGNGTGTTNYYLSEIVNNSLAGTTYLDGKFISGLPADYTQLAFAALGKQMTGTGVTTRTMLCLDNKGYTQLDPNAQPSSGTYSIKMYNENYTLSSWVNNQQCIMKRASSSVTLSDLNQAGTVNVENGSGRMVADGFLLSSGLNTFSIFVPSLLNVIVVLPIDLLSLNAVKKSNNSVDVLWSTLSERNNDYFIVKKSIDGIDWNEIARVNGAGNSLSKIAYFINDNSEMSEVVYYQLSQVDFDGNQVTFDPVSVRFSIEQGAFYYVNMMGQIVDFENVPAGVYLKVFENGETFKVFN